MGFVAAALASETDYDVIVVGSGAAGGQTAYTLAMEGARVLMLEAGRRYSPEVETPMFQAPDHAPLRAASTPDKPFGFHDATVDGGWQVPGEPYVNASEHRSRRFDWWRARMLGGRTNHWGRISLRNGPYDFKPRRRDGLGFDWPIGYEDVAPYYDKVEMLIGVYGANDGLENTPDSPPGCLLPPPKPLVSDLLIQQRAGRLRIPVVPGHKAVLTQRLDSRRLPQLLHPGNVAAQKILRAAMDSRAACFWATPCGRGCSVGANYQSTTVHLPPALATGKLDIVTDAMVREVVLDRRGLARAACFIDKNTGKDCEVRARVVVLAAGACETVRILLNSKSAAFAQGLANSSGKVGRYLMDTVGSDVEGQVPLLENLPPHNEDGASGDHLYAPWWLYKEQLAGKLGFPRGYHIEFYGGRRMPGINTAAGLEWLTRGSYGRKFTLSDPQRSTATALCDVIIPSDAQSTSASAVGVVDFIDEWISAPYLRHQQDRTLVLSGLQWLDDEARRRYSEPFATLSSEQQAAICEQIRYLPESDPALVELARFFARYRDLTAAGFYTTPAGRKDLQYVGNVALARFEGPPREVLEAAGLVRPG